MGALGCVPAILTGGRRAVAAGMGWVEKPKHERSMASISTHPHRPGADSAAPSSESCGQSRGDAHGEGTQLRKLRANPVEGSLSVPQALF